MTPAKSYRALDLEFRRLCAISAVLNLLVPLISLWGYPILSLLPATLSLASGALALINYLKMKSIERRKIKLAQARRLKKSL